MHENRQHIIDQATQLFRQKGYSATSINEIIGACGVTKGALYHHFQSKEQLALAAIAQVEQYFMQNIFITAQPPADKALLQLQKFNRQIEQFFSQHEDGCLLANLTLELGASYELFKTEILNYFKRWENSYYYLFSNFFNDAQARTLAIDTLAQIQGCILMYRASGDLSVLKRAHAKIHALCSS